MVDSSKATVTAGGTSMPAARGAGSDLRAPNELGLIPVVEYHLIGDRESRWGRERSRFRKDLEILYARGYRPVTMSQVVDRKIDLPAGLSPVVFTFDDASPGQFSYIERDGKLEIDPNSAMGIWLDFRAKHPDWENKAVFCLLPAATEGHAFFGNKGIKGQKTEWRFQKVKWLADNGFELCNHTLWHAKLNKYSDAVVQEQIARGVLAIDSAVPGYNVRTFALPLGLWPKNKELAKRGSWTDPKSKKTVRYDFDAILQVAGGPTRSPYDPAFEMMNIKRVEVFGSELEKTLDMLDKSGKRYVSDGSLGTVAKPNSRSK
jgi:peptidoglycan/xylan/chitin deacetylase (PgdA/CDA1 family)